MTKYDAALWLAAVLLVLLKLALLSGVTVDIKSAPHDDSLYVERAMQLLSGDAFGPYDSHTLVKYPGMSLWLAATHFLGIPFLASIHALYIASGVYLALAFLKAGVSRWIVLMSLALYFFNPVTFGNEWVRVIREPLDTGLLVVIFAAMAHMLVGLRERRIPWVHLGVFAIAFAFSMLLREENRLLWAVLGLFVLAVAWQARGTLPIRRMLIFLVPVLLVPAALAKTYEYSLRAFVGHYYGQPILHDFGEGEYPRLLAAIRSIDTAKDNRLVMAPQEALAKLRQEVPAFAPVVERLPAPGNRTYSCQLHGVCSEWSNGWMLYWIKDEAFRAGLTPSLPAAQDYFRRVRTDIESACAAGKFSCTDKGEGFLRPMELRWTRAYVAEGFRLARMALVPDINFKWPGPHDVPEELVRKYRTVTLSDGPPAQPTSHSSVQAKARDALVAPYQLFAALLLIAALTAFAVRLWIAERAPLSPMALLGVVAGAYILFRLAALTYVAVFLGPFVSRIVFSTYTLSVIIALPFIAETVSAWRKTRTAAA